MNTTTSTTKQYIESDTEQLAIGFRKDGKVDFIGASSLVYDQCEAERRAFETGEYERIIRINRDGSIFELRAHTSVGYEELSRRNRR